MGDVLAFAGFAEAVSFDGLGQDDGRRARVLDRSVVSRMDLDRVVTTQTQACELLVREMLYHLEQAGFSRANFLAEVAAALDEILLILTVGQLARRATPPAD